MLIIVDAAAAATSEVGVASSVVDAARVVGAASFAFVAATHAADVVAADSTLQILRPLMSIRLLFLLLLLLLLSVSALLQLLPMVMMLLLSSRLQPFMLLLSMQILLLSTTLHQLLLLLMMQLPPLLFVPSFANILDVADAAALTTSSVCIVVAAVISAAPASTTPIVVFVAASFDVDATWIASRGFCSFRLCCF